MTLAVVALAAVTTASNAQPLRFGGSGSGQVLLSALVSSYIAKVPGARSEQIPGLGGSGGLRALGDKALDVTIAGRPLRPAEQAKGLAQRRLFVTPFILATSQERPNSLTTEQIVALFSSDAPTWSDGKPVRFILRDANDSDTADLLKYFPRLVEPLERKRRIKEIPIADSDKNNADLAEQTPGSLAMMTYVQLVSEKRRLKAIQIDGVTASLERMQDNTYKPVKTIYLMHAAQPSPLVTGFLEFVTTPEAAKLAREHGATLALD